MSDVPRGAHVAGRVIKTANFRNTKDEWGYHPAAATTQWEVLFVSDLNGLTPEMTVADGDTLVECTGQLFVAMHDCDPDTARPTQAIGRAHPGPVVVGPVDTSSFTAVGSPVYLNAAGAVGASAEPNPGYTRVVGSVVVKDATNGYWLFEGSPGGDLPTQTSA